MSSCAPFTSTDQPSEDAQKRAESCYYNSPQAAGVLMYPTKYTTFGARSKGTILGVNHEDP